MSALGPFNRATARLGPVNRRLILLLVALVIVFGLLLGHRLFNAASLRSMAYQLPELGILSLAMMIPLLSGGLDLSIIATADLSALAMAWILTHMVPAHPGFAWVAWQVAAIVAGLVLAAIVGMLNGLIIAYLEVSPILTTLGMMTLIKGISIGLTHGGVLSGFPAPIVFIGNGDLWGVPIVLLIFVALAIPVGIMLTRSPFGQVLNMLGSNEAATRYSGVDTRRALVKVYILSGVLASVAGVVMMARFNSANAAYGESYLLVTILAAVLGGISPSGGFGKVTGLVFALVILQLISTAFNLLNFSQFLTLAIWGATLILVAGVTRLREHFLR
ncbi:ABC transporter permease [Acidisoma sp. L85]|jgi:simple sugar transport system permease protein|uniref:ABC transporter permease n=1 Tax=Acidisoma sp. L85 TaxID=1641850 RepID=UPI00131BBB06|nr:ABC transporter permease [Acidisoma sp. L85]